MVLDWWDLAWLMGTLGGQRSEHSPAGASHLLGGLAEAGMKDQPRMKVAECLLLTVTLPLPPEEGKMSRWSLTRSFLLLSSF